MFLQRTSCGYFVNDISVCLIVVKNAAVNNPLKTAARDGQREQLYLEC